MITLVEGFDADAVGLARFLALAGETVRLAAPGPETADVAALREFGIQIQPNADLDTDPGPAEIAYLDVWTPEVAPRVGLLRAQGTRVSCLGDLLLERWPGPTIGITGTAGKTTTTAIVGSMLRLDGRSVALSAGARAGNLWPTADLLGLLPSDAAGEMTLVLELTSSHLALMRNSPNVGAVVSFWPDHLELHGGLVAYRAAKATIARHQSASDTLVVNADDASVCFAGDARGSVIEFSLQRPASGAYRDPSGVIVLGDSGATVGPIDARAVHPANVVAAAAIAASVGTAPAAIGAGVASIEPLPYRGRPIATHDGVVVVDDGMAATPTKTAALLATFARRSVVLVAGGMEDSEGGPVHGAPEERALLSRVCDEVARAAVAVVLFGAAGARMEALLAGPELTLVTVPSLEDAVDTALRLATEGTSLVFSPMFPVPAEERAGFEAMVARSVARRHPR
jgi:UDP-N-acetylmuramoylalanine--D-glutamate ligase